MRVASDLLLPHLGLSYSFTVSLGLASKPHILIRVAVKHVQSRHLSDNDTPDYPIPVIAAPLGVKAHLSPRPVAGDALTTSVLTRWREAGLLPNHPDTDNTVVFLTLEDGAELPFPRACVVTNHPVAVRQPMSEPTKSPLQHKKLSKASSYLWTSRKRPRSPSSHSDDLNAIQSEPSKEQPRNDFLSSMLHHQPSSDAPTAHSLNAALQSSQSSDPILPVPLLHHPLVQPIAPPSFLVSQQSPKEEPVIEAVENTNLQNSKISDPQDKPAKSSEDIKKAPVAKEENVSSPAVLQNSVKSEPAHQPTHSTNGIDAFLLDGEAGNVQEKFDAGLGMDMTDFAAFEDDVTGLFDGMDDRLPGVDNALLQDEDAGRSVAPSSADLSKKTSNDGELPSLQQETTCTSPSKMDVDSDALAEGADLTKSNGNAEEKVEDQGFTTEDVVKVALSAIRTPVPTSRPKREAVSTQLSSFFEDDLTDRRRFSLNAARSISKRRPKRRSVVKETIFQHHLSRGAKPTDVIVQNASVIEMLPSRPPVGHKKSSLKTLRSLYVPRKKIRAFTKLRRRGIAITDPSVLIDDSTSDDGASSDEEGIRNTASSRSHIQKKNCNTSFSAVLAAGMGHDQSKGEGSTVPEATDSHQGASSPLKIANSVAVDCASVCMVLAADRDFISVHTGSSGELSSSIDGSEANGSSTGGTRDEDLKPSSGCQSVQSGSKGALQGSMSKSHISSVTGSAAGRMSAKRDRDLSAMLSLLEMQMFSTNELEIFPDLQGLNGNRSEAVIVKEVASSKTDPESVSSATMRRVLLGLPRALETSRVFGSCLASFRTEDEDAPAPSIQGPLSINDFLGGSASVFPLESPRVCVGFNTEWIEVSSNALSMWEKAGFEPYSEKKNVVYVAVAPKELEVDAKLFLRDVSAAYEECSFGRHSAMPFDALTLIANSVSKPNGDDKSKVHGPLTDVDRAMAEQYHLAITGLCTKLAAVMRDHRKNLTGSPTNIVAYIVSPFEKELTAANVALLRAIAPLVNPTAGAVPSGTGTNLHTTNLTAAPWRSSPGAKSSVFITVRLIPREVVDRRLSGHAELEYLVQRPLRPQLMKAVAFAVFNSISYKRVKMPSLDGEVAHALSRASLMPDDLMSPMTPDIVGESSGPTPVSPMGNTADESHAYAPQAVAAHNAAFVDQSSALSPSFLHEPVVVLAGVGKHMGQTESRPNIVLHLAYSFCESASRYLFAWTSQRGEMLDIASVPVSKIALSPSRRKAFWGMWARGQRWRMSYVKEVHATISKAGCMDSGEIEDWEWVISKLMGTGMSLAEKKCEDDTHHRVVRRFPPTQAKSEDISDVYTDLPTPATPGVAQSQNSGLTSKSSPSLDIKMPSMSSVSILSICTADTHLFMEKAGDGEKDRRDFAIVSEASLSKARNVQAHAILARFEDDGMRAIEVNVLRHYGKAEAEEMADDRSPWDSFDIQTIGNTIAVNFHELRYVASPPSWPHKRWLSMYPIHVDAVLSFERNLRHVQKFGHSSAPSGIR